MKADFYIVKSGSIQRIEKAYAYLLWRDGKVSRRNRK